MCEPSTIVMLGMAVAGAVAQNQTSNAAVMNQAEVANRNTAEDYRVAQQQDRNAAAQAFEQQTDRMRQTSRQLSMARVVAAQGGGSLAANAINISAAADEDFSRVDAGLSNQKSTVRDQVAALHAGNQDAVLSANTALKGNQIKFFSDVGNAAATAYVTSSNRASQKKTAQNYAADYDLKRNKPLEANFEKDW
ncbi:virion core protein, T7 gp14 family [Variovorax sp. YR566]|uniref:virion core protein, T7 gp14 family n=1 Tax=Variovorax sp. YR566 TaxID=3450237 RepID=UPI003F7E6AA3